jgi:Spy/CpxP family protein refolding chaperone
MLQRRITWLSATVLTSALVLATGAHAQNAPTPARQFGQGMPGNFQSALGLTEDQKKSVREIHAQQATNRKQVSEALQKAEAELRQLAVNGGDPNALAAKQTEVSQLLSRSVALRVESLQAISAILTPDQRAKLAQLNNESTGHGGPHKRRHNDS